MFFLDNPSSNKDTYILIRLSLDDGRFKKSTGEKVNPSLWNKSKNRVKPSKGNYEIARINQVLNDLENKVNNKITELRFKNEQVTRSDILDVFEGSKIKNKNLKYLVDVIDTMVDERLSLQKISKDTKKTYGTLKSRVRAFEEINGKILTKGINSEFYNKFIIFLYEKGYRDNTINKTITQLKSTLSYAKENGCFKIEPSKIIQNIRPRQTDDIALTSQELKDLEDLDLMGFHERVRDLFLVGVYSGQRYSDYSVFEREDVQGSFIIKTTEKTEDKSYIPITRKLKGLLEKYNWNLPKVNDVVFNRTIKKVCKMAGIDDLVKKTHFSGQNKTEEVQPKYNFVSSHTARRTFITLSLKGGMTYKAIMKITGIKKIETLLVYDKVNEQEIMRQAISVWG